MKILKYALSLCLMVLAIYSCSQDDTNTVNIDQIAAPKNVSASVRVTQDNTGLVTITPLGEGVANYNVNFGDASDPSDVVRPGFSLNHIYQEGSYEITIKANGINGLSTTVTQPLVVSFQAPQNLVVTITNDPTISQKVNVTAEAEFAMSYEVDFGEAGAAPVEGNIGEAVSFIYQEAGTYTITVTAFSAAVETTVYTTEFEVTAILQPLQAAPTPPARSANDVISIFSDVYANVPDTDYYPNWGQSTTYSQITVGGSAIIQYGNLNYQGIQFGTAVDASTMEFLHIDVWTADANEAKISPISSGPNETAFDLDLSPQQWTSFDIPLSFFTTQNPLVNLADLIQFKFDGVPAGGTIFVDNLYFYRGAAAPTDPIYAAPTPSVPAADVISMFSDAYTDVPVDTWRTDWSNATLEDVTVDGNATKKYSALNFVGIETVGSLIDASAMTHFHTDIWTADATNFRIKLVDFGANAAFGGGDDVEHEIQISNPAQGQWVGIDIPLSDFTGLITKGHIGQLIYSADPTGANTVYIDNVYYYNSSAAAGEPSSAAPTPTLPSTNVISIFSNAYTNVNVDTWLTTWSAGLLEEVTITGNDTKKYTNVNFVGIEATAPSIDASSMTYFHTDIWTPDATEFRIKLVDFGPDGTFGGGDDVEHEIVLSNPGQSQWVSLDIPLSSFEGLTTRSHISQLIYSGNPSGALTVYLDNVYFHN